MSRSIIDCQSHLFLPAVLELLRQRTEHPRLVEQNGELLLPMGSWVRKVPAHYWDVSAKLATMDAAGISMTLLSTNDPGPEWFGADGPRAAQLANDALAEIAAAHPTRFCWLCVLPLQDAAAAAAELERCRNDPRMKGVLLYTNLAGRWCDEPEFEWLFARAAEVGLPILLHPAKPLTIEATAGHELTSALGNMFEDTIALARIIVSGLLDRYPTVKLVCPHLGGALPFLIGRLDHQVMVLKRSNQQLRQAPSMYLRQIYFDVATPMAETIRFALEFIGPERLLFASDDPWVAPPVTLGAIRSLQLHADVEARLLAENARQLFALS
jgi:predicted TIM-barrel fold metal-dependent hydrolase